MAALDEETRAIIAGDVILLAVLAAFVTTLFVPMKNATQPPGAVHTTWPEPAEGRYAS